jgi:hypothetical protein
MLNYAVFEFIKNTTSIKSIYLVDSWSRWPKSLADSLNFTINAYLAINVRIYLVQQPPVQSIHSEQLYQNLVTRKELTLANIRKMSLTRKQYAEQQKEVDAAFAHFINVRGVTLISIDDIVCDKEVCTMGTGTLPYYTDNMHLAKTVALIFKDKLRNYMAF